MTVVQKRQVNKAYEVYLALYQGLTGSEDASNIYKQFSRDFFDLIVIDECHRGSARDDSAEQERIVARLEKLMKFCEELEVNIRQSISKADNLLQTALREALEPK